MGVGVGVSVGVGGTAVGVGVAVGGTGVGVAVAAGADVGALVGAAVGAVVAAAFVGRTTVAGVELLSGGPFTVAPATLSDCDFVDKSIFLYCEDLIEDETTM